MIAGSLITRPQWVALEKSISEIVGVLTPTQSDLVYLVYGIAILALPFVILIGLIVARQWKLLGAYAAAGAGGRSPALDQRQRHRGTPMALRPVRPTQHRAGPVPGRPAVDRDARGGVDRVGTVAARPLATLVVGAAAGLRADPPGHQRDSAGPLVAGTGGGMVRRRIGGPGGRHPALEVPLEGAVRALAKRGFVAPARGGPAGRAGPLVLSAASTRSPIRRRDRVVRPASAQRRRAASAVAEVRLRGSETAPLQTSMRRAVEHRALMAIAIGETGVANTSTIALAALDRGWTLYAHQPRSGRSPRRMRERRHRSPGCGNRCESSTTTRSPTATCAQRDHRRRRHGALRRVRQRRVRRHRHPTPIRHRPTPGDDVSAVRRGVCGRRGDRRVRQGHRPDRFASAHEIGCAETNPAIGGRRGRRDRRRQRRR